MMGIAHRLRSEFSCDELRDCANRIRQKFQDGTLKTSPREKDDGFVVAPDALVVAEAELPESLRGRFKEVFIQPRSDSREYQVVFALEKSKGIMCDNRKHLREFFFCSMADGVHAYRYQRL